MKQVNKTKMRKKHLKLKLGTYKFEKRFIAQFVDKFQLNKTN